jgi:hypothetical protein
VRAGHVATAKHNNLDLSPSVASSVIGEFPAALSAGGSTSSSAVVQLLSRSWSHISYGSALRYLNLTIGATERMVRTIVETQLRPAAAPATGKAGTKDPYPHPFLDFSLACRADLDTVRRTMK